MANIEQEDNAHAIVNRNIDKAKPDKDQTKVVEMGEVQKKCAGNSNTDKPDDDEERVKVVLMADIQAEESGKSNDDEERVKEQDAATKSLQIQPALPTTTPSAIATPSTNTNTHIK
jgi:hypothetical protein